MSVKCTLALLLAFAVLTTTAQTNITAPTAGEINALKTNEARSKNKKPPKVSELLKKSNDTMNLAQDAYIDGDAKKAIDLYRRALRELTNVELQNPERAAGAEFAPLRFRKALCETEIDRIMLEEVTANARSIAVTDTSELEKKREERKQAARKHKLPDPAHKLSASKSAQTADSKKTEEKDKAQKPKLIQAKKTVETEKLKDSATPLKAEEIAGVLESAKDLHSVGKFDKAIEALIAILKVAPDHKESRFMLALIHVQSGNGEDAVILIEDLVSDYPRETSVLLLAAAAYVAAGQPMVALDRLDEAVRCEPNRPDAYRNIAWLLTSLTPDKTENAEAYYRQSVKLGAKRDAELEKLLGF